MPLSLLLVLGAIGLFLYLRGRSAEVAASRIADPDAAPLEELARAGSDLTRPHDLEFFLYLPSEAAAERVAEELRRRGLAVTRSPELESQDWLCLATMRQVPTLESLREFRRTFTALAEAEEGVYDGWGATVHSRGGEESGH